MYYICVCEPLFILNWRMMNRNSFYNTELLSTIAWITLQQTQNEHHSIKIGPHPSSLAVGGVPHPRSGLGYPIPGPDGGGGCVIHPADWGYPTQDQDGGYPIPGLGRGYPILLTGGVPTSKIRTGYPEVPPVQDWIGYPHPRLDGVLPPGLQSDHVLRGGQRASCIHAGGLSCWKGNINIEDTVFPVLSWFECHFPSKFHPNNTKIEIYNITIAAD